MKRLLLCVLLAGCAGKPPVTVSVPVMVACIAPEAIPTRPDPLPELPQDANAALALALDKLVDWKAYGIEAGGKLEACATVR